MGFVPKGPLAGKRRASFLSEGPAHLTGAQLFVSKSASVAVASLCKSAGIYPALGLNPLFSKTALLQSAGFGKKMRSALGVGGTGRCFFVLNRPAFDMLFKINSD